jgi:hypothetical protein
MRKALAIFALCTIAVLLGAGFAWGELSQSGTLRISFDGGFRPRALPRDRPVPVTLEVEGAISTTDGSRPPALQQFEIGVNRNGLLSTNGLPACSMPRLQSTTSTAALERCRPALVGQGTFGATVEVDGRLIPAAGEILAFNGRFRGGPAVLLHFYTATPTGVSLIMPLALVHQAKGQFGTRLETKIPVLAGGFASITKIQLKIGREYNYRGQRRSFLSASCAAPAGFPQAIFNFARGDFHFADGKTISTVLTRQCRVRGG